MRNNQLVNALITQGSNFAVQLPQSEKLHRIFGILGRGARAARKTFQVVP